MMYKLISLYQQNLLLNKDTCVRVLPK